MEAPKAEAAAQTALLWAASVAMEESRKATRKGVPDEENHAFTVYRRIMQRVDPQGE